MRSQKAAVARTESRSCEKEFVRLQAWNTTRARLYAVDAGRPTETKTNGPPHPTLPATGGTLGQRSAGAPLSLVTHEHVKWWRGVVARRRDAS